MSPSAGSTGDAQTPSWGPRARPARPRRCKLPRHAPQHASVRAGCAHEDVCTVSSACRCRAIDERCSAICARWRVISSSMAATRSRSPEPARTGARRAGPRAGVRLGAATRSGRAVMALRIARAILRTDGGELWATVPARPDDGRRCRSLSAVASLNSEDCRATAVVRQRPPQRNRHPPDGVAVRRQAAAVPAGGALPSPGCGGAAKAALTRRHPTCPRSATLRALSLLASRSCCAAATPDRCLCASCCSWRTTTRAAAGTTCRCPTPRLLALQRCARRLPGEQGEATKRDAADTPRRYYGGSVRASHVLCCVPQEGVLLMHALLRPGQHVVVTAPGYQSLYGLAKAMGYALACAQRQLACAEPPPAAARSRLGCRHAPRPGS